ncbi:hypothetical protein H6P81_020367 [Aristolochia fimbriata]|uniref:Uncharacterized protein n=1 Tax=Aristolochia fimbriata TaxID=158543 RepID=A0AAV7DYH2_ARIFI|nr:hypothetical protein H6P81_020367 [Aristolochia fimbriata]
MAPETLIQGAILLLTLAMFYFLQTVPPKAMALFRRRNRSAVQAKRHFVAGAQQLARARAARDRHSVVSFAKSASVEADKALALDPRDAAAHILKALSLDLQNHKTAALRSLDTALAPPAVKSLSSRERGDALFKRAQVQIDINRRRRLDPAVSDLVEAVKLSPENAKAFCLLGNCYELKEMREEAKNAYEAAVTLDASSEEAKEAKEALKRLS